MATTTPRQLNQSVRERHGYLGRAGADRRAGAGDRTADGGAGDGKETLQLAGLSTVTKREMVQSLSEDYPARMLCELLRSEWGFPASANGWLCLADCSCPGCRGQRFHGRWLLHSLRLTRPLGHEVRQERADRRKEVESMVAVCRPGSWPDGPAACGQ